VVTIPTVTPARCNSDSDCRIGFECPRLGCPSTGPCPGMACKCDSLTRSCQLVTTGTPTPSCVTSASGDRRAKICVGGTLTATNGYAVKLVSVGLRNRPSTLGVIKLDTIANFNVYSSDGRPVGSASVFIGETALVAGKVRITFHDVLMIPPAGTAQWADITVSSVRACSTDSDCRIGVDCPRISCPPSGGSCSSVLCKCDLETHSCKPETTGTPSVPPSLCVRQASVNSAGNGAFKLCVLGNVYLGDGTRVKLWAANGVNATIELWNSSGSRLSQQIARKDQILTFPSSNAVVLVSDIGNGWAVLKFSRATAPSAVCESVADGVLRTRQVNGCVTASNGVLVKVVGILHERDLTAANLGKLVYNDYASFEVRTASGRLLGTIPRLTAASKVSSRSFGSDSAGYVRVDVTAIRPAVIGGKVPVSASVTFKVLALKTYGTPSVTPSPTPAASCLPGANILKDGTYTQCVGTKVRSSSGYDVVIASVTDRGVQIEVKDQTGLVVSSASLPKGGKLTILGVDIELLDFKTGPTASQTWARIKVSKP
ncbi:MAG: hypothetical protein V1708_02240, partial [Candidatus Micrarchaeota archaeon]